MDHKITSVLIVDNNSVGFFGLESLLKRQLKNCTIHKESEMSFIDNIAEHYNIAIWNNDIADDGAIEAIKKFKKLLPNCKILVVVTKNTKVNVIQYFELGINGYTNLNCSKDQLIQYINEILNNGIVISENDIKNILQDMQLSQKKERALARLTQKEKIVMDHLCQGLKIKNISNLLGLSISTISTQKHRILKKLELNNMVELINLESSLVNNI